MSFGARALIRLGALNHNLKIIRAAAPGAKVMAVVKANAYGHGLLAVAEHLTSVDALAVARVPEALLLRERGITTPIVLLAGVLDADEMQSAVKFDLDVVVHSEEQLALLAGVADADVGVWLKFDTGMHRLGFPIDQAPQILDAASTIRAVRELRLMTHFAEADDQSSAVTEKQTARFIEATAGFDGPVSIANSAGILGWPEVLAAFEGREVWVRPGLSIFGAAPFANTTGHSIGLKPVMQFEARLIAKKRIKKGARVGYGGDYVAPADAVLGIVSAGYGDGYSRHFRSGTPVHLNQRNVTLAGRVSMDMIALDLGPQHANDRIGDVAILWGDSLPVEQVAPYADATPYDLVCGVMNREESKIVD